MFFDRPRIDCSNDWLAASAIAGGLWTLISPTAAFLYAAAWMLLALTGLIISRAR